MTLLLQFTHDEIQEQIPYQIIAETTSSARWNTGKRKRLFAEQFTEKERYACSKIKQQAYIWALIKGVPANGIKMMPQTYELWQKFADFCASL